MTNIIVGVLIRLCSCKRCLVSKYLKTIFSHCLSNIVQNHWRRVKRHMAWDSFQNLFTVKTQLHLIYSMGTTLSPKIHYDRYPCMARQCGRKLPGIRNSYTRLSQCILLKPQTGSAYAYIKIPIGVPVDIPGQHILYLQLYLHNDLFQYKTVVYTVWFDFVISAIMFLRNTQCNKWHWSSHT